MSDLMSNNSDKNGYCAPGKVLNKFRFDEVKVQARGKR